MFRAFSLGGKARGLSEDVACFPKACFPSRSQQPLPCAHTTCPASSPAPAGSPPLRTGSGGDSRCPQTGQVMRGRKFLEMHLVFSWGFLLSKLWTGS